MSNTKLTFILATLFAANLALADDCCYDAGGNPIPCPVVQGPPGPQGPQGPVGPQGPQGPQGIQGVGATVVDNGNGTVTVTGANGSANIYQGSSYNDKPIWAATNANTAAIAVNASNIQKNATAISNNTYDIQTNAGNIIKLQGTVAGVASTVNNVSNSVQQFANQESTNWANQQSINGNQAETNAMQATFNTNQLQINANQSSINAIQGGINDNQNAINLTQQTINKNTATNIQQVQQSATAYTDQETRRAQAAEYNLANDLASYELSNDGQISNINSQITQIHNNMNRLSDGVASAMAMSSIPQASKPGHVTIGMGVANFKQSNAMALGGSYLTEDGSVTIKANISYSKTATSSGFGAAYTF